MTRIPLTDEDIEVDEHTFAVPTEQLKKQILDDYEIVQTLKEELPLNYEEVMMIIKDKEILGEKHGT